MIAKIPKPVFKEIDSISPSQFNSMKNCSYKSLLSRAFKKKPLLPVSPNAYFGTVLHKLMELVAKRIISDEKEFNLRFDLEIEKMESWLNSIGFTHILPLQKNVKDFAVKKILLRRYLNTESSIKPSTKNFIPEKEYKSKDGRIVGKIDLVIESESETEIIDFKTGAISTDVLDDDGEKILEVKEEYVDQLKLYSYVYFESTGRFPTKLSLIDLGKQKYTVEFSKEDCLSSFEEAKAVLKSANEEILSGNFTAKPSIQNCKYCLYRPACSFFRDSVRDTNSYNDVSGNLEKVSKYLNGNVTVFLKGRSYNSTITGFPVQWYDSLNTKIGVPIFIFNLRRTPTEALFSATKTSMIYE